MTLVLFGLAIARTGLVYRWLGFTAIVSGLLYGAIGVSVGYSGFEQPGDLVVSLLLLVFMVGVLVAGLRRQEPAETVHDRGVGI